MVSKIRSGDPGNIEAYWWTNQYLLYLYDLVGQLIVARLEIEPTTFE